MWGNYPYSCKSHCIICQMTKQLNWRHAKVKMLAPRNRHREFGQSNCVPSPAALQGEPWEWLKKLRTECLPTNKVAAWIWICVWSFCSALIRYPLVSLPYLFLLFLIWIKVVLCSYWAEQISKLHLWLLQGFRFTQLPDMGIGSPPPLIPSRPGPPPATSLRRYYAHLYNQTVKHIALHIWKGKHF